HWIFALLAGSAGCHHEPRLALPGVSEVPPEAPSSARGSGDAGAPWERAAESAGYRRLVPRQFPSEGHFAGRWNAEIAGNESAESAFASLGPKSSAPVGAVIVERMFDRKTGAPGPVFAMEKEDAGYFAEGGDWKFVVATPALVLEDAGQLPLCARCHAEAGP